MIAMGVLIPKVAMPLLPEVINTIMYSWDEFVCGCALPCHFCCKGFVRVNERCVVHQDADMPEEDLRACKTSNSKSSPIHRFPSLQLLMCKLSTNVIMNDGFCNRRMTMRKTWRKRVQRACTIGDFTS
jgi:hypothetical protein